MRETKATVCALPQRGGFPLAFARPGESLVVLCCNARDRDLERHLSALGLGTGAIVRVLGNENGRLMVLVGDARIGIDKNLAQRIRVAPYHRQDGHPRNAHRCQSHGCCCSETLGRSNAMNVTISADAMSKGQEGIVKQVKGDRAVNRRLRDMGMTPGSRVRCEGKAPLGDPIELAIMGYKLTLRKSEAEGVLVEVDR